MSDSEQPREPISPQPPAAPHPDAIESEGSEIDLARVHGSILREHYEPKEGRESIPLWFVTLAMVLIFWGGLYLSWYSGGFRSDVFTPSTVGDAGPAAPMSEAELGKRLFMQNCALCHQASGGGIPHVYPPLAGSEWVEGRDWHGDSHLAGIILRGLQGPIQVEGTTFNGAMPPWNILRDDEIAAILTYVRSQWGNHSPPIPAGFVHEIREQTASRAEPWSVGELQSLARRDVPAAALKPSQSPAGSPVPILMKAAR